MLDIDKLIRHFDEPFIEITKELIFKEIRDDIMDLVIKNKVVGYYIHSIMYLELTYSLWNKVSRLYNKPYIRESYYDDSTIELMRDLFKRNINIKINEIK